MIFLNYCEKSYISKLSSQTIQQEGLWEFNHRECRDTLCSPSTRQQKYVVNYGLLTDCEYIHFISQSIHLSSSHACELDRYPILDP